MIANLDGSSGESMWATDLFPAAFERSFAPLPDIPLWQWADENVWLSSKVAAESGPYRSAKTPWTRRLQELIQRPVMYCYDFSSAEWIEKVVKEINKMKCSQGGVSEGVMNGIRYKANFRPCNVIYSVDTRETAADISERLEPSLRQLDSNIFTGDDSDVGTFVMRLRAMDIWFQGSFSSGKFASKQAPFVVADEVEEHGTEAKDASTISRLKSRKKCADDGLQINLCKPKLEGGPIHKAFIRGNQEELMVACPHCNARQPLTFFRNEDEPHPRLTAFTDELVPIQDEQTGKVLAILPTPLPLGQRRKMVTGRIVFEHCKDLLGGWDRMRILRDTYFECGPCGGHLKHYEALIKQEKHEEAAAYRADHEVSIASRGRIDEHLKRDLVAAAIWIPTAIGTPGIVSQHISDLYSTDANSTWGQIVLDYLQAKAEGRREQQGWTNDRLGLPWRERVFKTQKEDILENIAGRNSGDGCPPYKRGTVPVFTEPSQGRAIILLGGDVMLNFARWAAGVLLPNYEDIAIIDWGEEVDPHGIAEMMMRSTWPIATDPAKKARIQTGFLDSHWRPTDTYKACMAVPHQALIPCVGIGGYAARSVRVWAWNHIPTYPRWFNKLTFNDREAKDELYLNRIKERKRRVYFPIDVEKDPQFIDELCADEIEENDDGVPVWNEHPPDNHYGDCVKEIVAGLRFLTRKNQSTGDGGQES